MKDRLPVIVGGGRTEIETERKDHMQHLIVTGIQVDDFLDDWARYCRDRGQQLGAPEGEDTCAFLVTSEGRECHLHISGTAGKKAEALADVYLADFTRRHPDAAVEKEEDEQAARDRSLLEETIALIFAE